MAASLFPLTSKICSAGGIVATIEKIDRKFQNFREQNPDVDFAAFCIACSRKFEERATRASILAAFYRGLAMGEIRSER